MSSETPGKPAIGPVEGTAFLTLVCFTGLVLIPSVMTVSVARPLSTVTVWAWMALVLGEEIVRFMVVSTGRRIGVSWPWILFAIWLPFTALEWVTGLLGGGAETVGHLALIGTYLLFGGTGHVLLTLYYAKFRPRIAFILALVSHLAWNTLVLISVPETRAVLLS